MEKLKKRLDKIEDDLDNTKIAQSEGKKLELRLRQRLKKTEKSVEQRKICQEVSQKLESITELQQLFSRLISDAQKKARDESMPVPKPRSRSTKSNPDRDRQTKPQQQQQESLERVTSLKSSTAPCVKVPCDDCYKIIDGVRFRCLQCFDVTVCGQCMRNGVHSNHKKTVIFPVGK